MMDSGTHSKPNVLIFMTDQQTSATILDGYKPRAITPHLDRLRTRAVTFSNAYTPSPHCCPSRASFFTSKYPSEHGVWNNVHVSNALARGPKDGTPFWSYDFARAGYKMAFSGKWHVSNFQRPSDFGWEELAITAGGFGAGMSVEQQRREAKSREMKLFENLDKGTLDNKRQPGEVIRPGWPGYTHYGTDEDPFGDLDVVNKAVDYINRHPSADDKDAPWCMYVGTLGPHDPYMPPARFLDWYDLDDIELPDSFDDTLDDKPGLYSRTRDHFDQLTIDEHRDALRHYLAFCSYEDELFGKLIAALEATGQLDDTIVVYLSDHGDYVAEHGLWGKGLPAFQSAYRIPCVISGPGIAPEVLGTTCETATSIVDIGPTLSALCGVTAGQPVSGRSLVNCLAPNGAPDPDPDVFFQSNGNEAYGIQRAIVSNGWKLVYNMFDHDELYDLRRDPHELTNLLAKPRGQRLVGRGPLATIPAELRDKVQDLYLRLWNFCIEHDDENINGYILTALAPFGPGIVEQFDLRHLTRATSTAMARPHASQPPNDLDRK